MSATDVLAVVWLSRNMTDAILRTLLDPEEADWQATDDALTVIQAMPASDVKDALRFSILRARREA